MHSLFAFTVVSLCMLWSGVDGVQSWDKEEFPFKQDIETEGFRFASYYQDYMVLQQAPHNAIIWGYGNVSATITVQIEAAEYTTRVMEGPDGVGIWKVMLKPHKVGGPYTINASQVMKDKSIEKIDLKQVLFGEVWLCSGQSNMQMSVQVIFNASYEMSQAVHYPDVRLFYVARVTSETALFDLKGIAMPWSIPTPDKVKVFSAVCWLYGRYLYDKLKIPIGLVHSSWGGTPVETWSSMAALKTCGLNKSNPPPTTGPPQNNSIVRNAMIQPLLNMTIKGVVWYQGEQNTHYHMNDYNCSFPAMIEDWRKSWYSGTGKSTDPVFPFGFVQLSVLNEPNWVDNGAYSTIRWHQTADYGYAPNSKMPNTFMAVAIDLLDTGIPYGSPHMRDKQDVAKRLALGSSHHVYGCDVVFDGPFPQSIYATSLGAITVEYQQSSKIMVQATQNFQICCVPQNCDQFDPFSGRVWANTTVVSWKSYSLQIDATACPLGVSAVRYAWTVTPCQFKKCQVYNDAGLPAPPFYFKLM